MLVYMGEILNRRIIVKQQGALQYTAAETAYSVVKSEAETAAGTFHLFALMSLSC